MSQPVAFVSSPIACRVALSCLASLVACVPTDEADAPEATEDAPEPIVVLEQPRVTNPNALLTGAWVDGGSLRDADRFDNAAMSPDGRLALRFRARTLARDRWTYTWQLSPTQAPPPGVLGQGVVDRGLLDRLLARDAAGAVALTEVVSEGAPIFEETDDFSQQLTVAADVRLGGGFAVRIGGADARARRAACGRDNPSVALMAPGSAYECRRLLVVQPAKTPGAPSATLRSAQLAVVMRVYEAARPERRLATPEIESAVFVTPFRALTDTEGQPVIGIEPSMTADGRLLLHAYAQPFFSFSETPWEPVGWTRRRPVMRLPDTEAMGGLADRPICLATRDAEGRCTGTPVTFRERYPVAAFPFRNPDGSPYRGQGGRGVFGASYPWISFDGTELFFNAGGRALRAYVGQGTRGAIKHIDHQANVVRGRYCIAPTFRSIEAKGDCTETEGTRMGQPLGTHGGLWRLFPEQQEVILPLGRRAPMHILLETNPLLGNLDPRHAFNTNTTGHDQRKIYAEVPMDDFSDGDFVAYYHLNELLRANNDREQLFQAGATPDTSGHYYTATLRTGAQLPYERDGGRDVPGQVNPGFLGRAVYLSKQGAIVVSRAAARARPTAEGMAGPLAGGFDAFTVELAARLLVPIETRFGALPLATAPLSWRLALVRRLDANGRPYAEFEATVWLDDTRTVTLNSGEVGTQSFRHVALTVKRSDVGSIGKLYVDGVLRQARNLGAGAAVRAVPASEANLLVLGPNGQDRAAPAHTELLLLDEVALSRVARPAEYLAAAAYQRFVPAGFTPGRAAAELPGLLSPAGTLPLGLDPRELRAPDAVLDLFVDAPRPSARFASMRALGEALFRDDVLTTHPVTGGLAARHAARSCASCHRDDDGFAHRGEALDAAVGSGRLAVNTPTALNRAFSTAQFFDRRAPDLVAQVSQPITNRIEMGGSMPHVLAALSAPESMYRGWFARAFSRPDGDVTRAELELALAVYTLSLLSGSSDVDQVLWGDGTGDQALDTRIRRGAQLFHGKARCTACHAGTNFSDEALHASGPSGVPTKTPTLRDVARTAPYFREGSHATLADVVRHYDRGGCRREVRAGNTVVPSVACDPELFPLGLTAAERADLVAFLEALNGQ